MIYNSYYSVVIILCALILMYYMGFGVSKLILPHEFRKNEFLIIPFIGLAILTTIPYYFAYFGINSKISLLILLLISSIINYIEIRKKPRIELNINEIFIPIIIAFIVLLIALSPLIDVGYLTVIGANGDAMTHCLVSEYLENNGTSPPDTTPSQPDLIIIKHRLTSHYPLGFHFFQSFINILSGTRAYANFSVLTGLFLSLNILSTYIFSRHITADKKTSVLAIALMAFNSVLFWVHYDDFGPNLLGVSLMPLAMSATLIALKSHTKKSLIFSSLLLAATFSTYSEAAYFIIIPVIFFIIIKSLIIKSVQLEYILKFSSIIIFAATFNLISSFWLLTSIFNRFLTILKTLILTAYINSPITYTADKSTIKIVDNGNIWHIIHIERIYGLLPFRTALIETYGILDSNVIILTIISIIISIVCISLYGLYNATKKLELISAIIPSIAIYSLLIYIYYPYWYFKVLTLTMFLFFVPLAIGIKRLYQSNDILKLTSVVFVLIFMFLNIYSLHVLTESVSKNGIVVDREYIEAASVLNNQASQKSKILIMSNKYQPVDDWSPYFFQTFHIFTNSVYHRNIKYMAINPNSDLYNIDNFRDVDYVFYRSKNSPNINSGRYENIYSTATYDIYYKNYSVVGHFPAETLIPTSVVEYHSGIIFSENVHRLFCLDATHPFKVHISNNTIKINQNKYDIKQSNSIKSVGFMFYSFENTSLKIKHDNYSKIVNLSAGSTLFILNVTEIPTSIEIYDESAISNVSIDWFELYNNNKYSTCYNRNTTIISIDMMSINSKNSLDLSNATIDENNSTLFNMFSENSISGFNSTIFIKYPYDVKLVFDIYNNNKKSPEHFGYWGVDIKSNKTYNLNFTLNVINKNAKFYRNNEEMPLNYTWTGDIDSGNFDINVAIYHGKTIEYTQNFAKISLSDRTLNQIILMNATYNIQSKMRIYNLHKNLSLLFTTYTYDSHLQQSIGHMGIYSFNQYDVSKYYDLSNKNSFMKYNGYFNPINVLEFDSTDKKYITKIEIYNDEQKLLYSDELIFFEMKDGLFENLKHNSKYTLIFNS